MVTMRALISRDRYFTRVATYYETFNHDLTASHERIEIEGSKITRFSTRSIDVLLDALIRYGRRGEKNFVIATHGNPNGLPIRLRSGSPVTMNHDIMDDLRAAIGNSTTAREGLLNMTSLNGAQVFRNAGELDSLLGKLRTVRSLQLDCLEFRGCNIGAGPALKAIHRLLNARITDGPTVQFMWTNLSTAHIRTISEDRFRRQLRRLGPNRRVFTAAEIYRGGTFDDSDNPVLAVEMTSTTMRIIARSRDMVKGFAQSYLQDPILFAVDRDPPGGGYRLGGRLPIIGFLPRSGPRPFVVPGDNFDYTEYIAREM